MPRAPRLHIVTGKGGVGKSTVCAALADAAAERGRVLAIELSPPAGLSRLLGVRPERPGDVVRVRGDLWLSCFDGAAALAEYLTRVVRLGPVLDVVFTHPLYAAFVGAAPGVRELMAIGKVRDELRQKQGVTHRWDTVVVDAGASGHALEHLRMPAAAARAFTAGRVHREGRRIDALLRDPARTAIHVVATPEEMPLKEASGIVARLRGDLAMPLGTLFVNMCRERPPSSIDDALARLERLPPTAPAPARALAAIGRREQRWTDIQERGIAALEADVRHAVVRLPRVPPNDAPRAAIAPIAREVLG